MGIYIPGMELPKPGERRIALFISADGVVEVCQSAQCSTALHHYLFGTEAVEVQPHGRLIDADELMDGWMNLREATKYGNKTEKQMSHSYSTMMMYEIADEIDGAETIIPADREATP